MVQPALQDIFQWEVRTWSRALIPWERSLPVGRPLKALAIGEREGGLSLWLASKCIDVVCSDLGPLPDATLELHARYLLQERISYAQVDVTDQPFANDSFDVVCFKSVIGALGSKEKQAKAISEIHRVLKPGGVLLFAENGRGTKLHAWLRARFVAWDHYWRYLHPTEDRDLFAPFQRVELATTGLLANLGRSEGQRDLLARIDALILPLVPAGWRTVIYGSATK